MPTQNWKSAKVTELKNLLTSGENTTGNLEHLEKLLLKDRILVFAIGDEKEKGKPEIITNLLRSEFITENPALLKKAVSVKDDNGRNALAQAVLSDNTEAVKALLNCEIITKDLVFFKELLRAEVEDKSNVLYHVASAETLKAFLENPTLLQDPVFLGEFLNHKDRWQVNPLVFVVSVLGKTEILEALLNNSFLAQNPDLLKGILNNKDIEGRNALHWVARHGKTETVKTLLEHNYSDPTLLKELLIQDEKGLNALALAARHGKTETVKTLLEHNYSDPTLLKGLLNQKDCEGHNALGLAVFNGDTKTVKAFLDSDIFAQNPDLLKKLLDNKDNSGFDVLDLAQLSSAPDMKEILLGHEYKNPTPSGKALNHSAIISNLGKMTEPPLQKEPIIVSDLTNKIIEKIKSPPLRKSI